MENNNNIRTGNLNPMYGKRHSRETKEKISNSQKLRYQAIKQAIHEHDLLQFADISDEARKELIVQLLEKNEIKFDNIQQVLTFLAILLKKERIKEVVKEEIDRFVASVLHGK